ncbi:hypothetical protein [Paenibacillus tuaregi]|uniref:hypothetical protein n=1 Tax=Paenibacillus tuaregi TaxID=1816681 RepID=UPI000837DBA8|nr:hypothetical protein [Paenibacillus tuaregi]
MTVIIVAIAYYAVLVLGLIGLIALTGAAAYGLTRLYAYVIECVLAAKKLTELFRAFMRERRAPERRVRK